MPRAAVITPVRHVILRFPNITWRKSRDKNVVFGSELMLNCHQYPRVHLLAVLFVCLQPTTEPAAWWLKLR